MVPSIQLTENGPSLSRIVAGVMKWGAWGKQLDARQMLQLIEQCIDLGINTFDHADIYGHYTTEEEFGAALAMKPALRQQMQLVTKCGIRMITPNRPHHKIKSYDTSIEHIIWSVEQSLKNLHTDYIDLLLIHRPDALLNPDDVAWAFAKLQAEGKVLHFGASNFTPSQFDLLNSRFALVTNQVEASILHMAPFHDGTFDQCLQYCMKPMVWSPLGGGDIFSKTNDERILRIQKTAGELAGKRANVTVDQILIAWLLLHPAKLLPVLGTANADRIKAAAESINIQLTREEWYELWQASAGREVD